MDAIIASRLLPTHFPPLFSSPHPNSSLPPFSRTRRIRTQSLASKLQKRQLILFPHVYKFAAFSSIEPCCSSLCSEQVVKEEHVSSSSLNSPEPEGRLLKCVANKIVLALFCFAIGFAPIRGIRVSAIAAPVAEVLGRRAKENEKEKEKGNEGSSRSHEYADCTRRLLETVSFLLRSIEEARKGNGDVKQVEAAWKAVKAKKEELQDGIMNGLHVELMELKRDKEKLENRSEEIVDAVVNTRREYEKSLGNVDKELGDMKERLEASLKRLEQEYSSMWERIGEIEDVILRKETAAMSFGVRELCFIERECEQLVQGFNREMRRKGTESVPKRPVTKLSKTDIQKELESVQRNHLEQIILPSVLEDNDLGSYFDKDASDFAQRIKQRLRESREMQKYVEARIRKDMKKFGDEKRFVVLTPEDEVVKGFPEIEMKWMFGDKEVMVPKAVSLHLYHGWKKWREEAKAELKKKLLENIEFGKDYIAEKQEHILLDRDRVMSKTWYNEEKKRWEMDPLAVPFAVSKKLVEHARIRHDWAVMYVAIKGDDKDYFVDIKEFDMLYEDFGGFDGLYMKMLANGIPTTVHLMWIPFSELNLQQQFLLTLRLSQQCFNALWKTEIVSYARDWVIMNFTEANDDIMMAIVFPILELVIPYPVRIKLGMAWPEEIDQAVDSTWYLKWQSEAEKSYKSRKRDDFQWFFLFTIRTVIYGYILFHVLLFLKRRIPVVLGFGPYRKDPNFRKLGRMKYYLKYRKRRVKQRKKAGFDPITRAFDQMKRVKNPPIPLKDFASIESMREEMNEVVKFLQNPRAFQEMGARAPRGVLIVGERGTGKTSLALAIAAEAKVPVVEVKAQELEAGLWVGQSASNVRELFQTARDLAPVIIFVEDFDLFAGVRGTYIHTKNQDHEAFINQLLVELDGFEKQDGVVLMATTRNLQQVDEALQRPGRMDRIFHLQRPTQAERERILQIAAKESMDTELIDFVDWKKVAEKTALLRPIELKLVPVALEGSAFRSKFLDTDELMSYCGWFATFSGIIPNWVRRTKLSKMLSKMLVNHLGLTLTKEDLQNVVDLMEPYGQISNGIEFLSPPIDWTREAKFPHAVWAAGRSLITVLLPNFDVVDNLWLEPLSWEGIGCTKITKARNEGSTNGNSESRSYLEKKLVFCFGSHIASQMLLPFGEENFLSSSELQQAQEIATRMVIQYGWGPDDSPAIYYHTNAETALSMGNNHEYEMATKIEKMYYSAFYKAKEMLQKNRQVLEKIVEELMEFEILTGKDLQTILEDNGGIREKEPFFLSKVQEVEPSSSNFLDEGTKLATALLSEAS
ncbi:hypothetical protein G4B88_012764 [Cannabis sativa]|uniref:AAA+ ATPase domain-containing protein n=1 Tax=Cannabis sativa TaxID=3483 RepID=A0A7J6GA54_CANSA|nr:hypothetical protein G4B88_012764 [Cannabis sativa]